MTDRELLMLAAKAAGHVPKDPELIGMEGWNPLDDDGDALRLAMELQMQVTVEDERCGAVCAAWGLDYDQYVSAPSESPETTYAATRRAIVLAAAQIGASK